MNLMVRRRLFPAALFASFAALVLVFVSCLAVCAAAGDVRRPNIVFILVDDLGWSDLACYGHPYHRTPNCDRLATEGLRLTQGYSSAPICSASRASILTGKSVAKLGFEFVTKNEPGHQEINGDVPLRTPAFKLDLPLAERTVAERLSGLGYDTAFFGKWHVSRHYQGRYLAWHPEFGPRQQGFDFAREDFGDHPYAWKKSTQPADAPEGEYPFDTLIDSAAKFVRGKGESETPYFLMVSTYHVHTPVKNRCRWLVDQYESRIAADSVNRSKRLEYAAFVETLDHHVGEILQAIDETGQRDNTLVMFMSDNGGHPEYCANAPLRGSKWNLYEGGIRVPMIARWPQKIIAGTTSSAPVIGYDLLPTFVDVAGGEGDQVDGEGVDGISVCGLFTDTAWQPDRSLIWHFPYYHPERGFAKAIDQIGISDFVVSRTRPQSAIRHGSYKLIHFAEDDRVELFDLSKDIGEQNELSETLPAVAESLRASLKEKLRSVSARQAVPLPSYE
tara:strand:+ start:381435 stop:382943 length:1509 start_codon:yes stop_codon:yes gene_type:complete